MLRAFLEASDSLYEDFTGACDGIWSAFVIPFVGGLFILAISPGAVPGSVLCWPN